MKWKIFGSIAAGLLLLGAWTSVVEAVSSVGEPSARLQYRRPGGPPPFPPDNAYSQAKADVGRKLFFDPILSASGKMSCATCHKPELGWGDGLPLAIGDAGEAMGFRSPTMLDLAWLPRLGWEGIFPDIEAVTFAAITGRVNMDVSQTEAIERLSAEADYRQVFAAAFGAAGITRHTIEQAVATYERTIVSGEAPFDRWVSGNEMAISAAAKRGFALFDGRAGCAQCHSEWSFTDGSFNDIGVGQRDDIGRGRLFPGSVKLQYAFKTPSLRNVAQRAPYMHNGSVPTLAAVIDLYNQGGIDRPSRSRLIHPLGLSDEEKTDLIAFLNTLTSAPSP